MPVPPKRDRVSRELDRPTTPAKDSPWGGLRSRYRALAHAEIPCPSGDSLATALCELRDDLAGYPLFGALGLEWANALCGTIDGMMREYQWRLAYRKGTDARGTLPSYEEYVATGRYSIG